MLEKEQGFVVPVVLFYFDFGFGPAKVDILVRHPTEDIECVGVYMSFLVQS